MRWLPIAMLIVGGCAGRQRQAAWVNPHADEAIGTVREMYDGRLTPALAATTFRNIDRLFPSRIIAHGPTAVPLLPASTLLSAVTCTSRDQVVSLDEYMRLNRVSGLLVLKQGRIALGKQ